MIYNYEELSFQILNVIRITHDDGSFEVKKRPYAALSYKLEGNAEFEISGSKLLTAPKDIIFIPANTEYKVTYSSNSSIVVHMTDCNYTEAECFGFGNKAYIEVMFTDLMCLWEKNRSAHQLKARVYDILYNLSEEHRLTVCNPMFLNAVEYMKNNCFNTDMDINKICDTCCISRTSLQKLFLSYYGISPKQYLLKLRMDNALTLLAEERRQISEIALLCGFKDEKYFSRLFRKKFGYPPSHFREI